MLSLTAEPDSDFEAAFEDFRKKRRGIRKEIKAVTEALKDDGPHSFAERYRLTFYKQKSTDRKKHFGFFPDDKIK